MDALLNLVLAIPADKVPGIAAGGIWGLLAPLLLGMLQQVIREWLRNRKMANAGAAQQREANEQAQVLAEARAAKVTAYVDEMSDAELADFLTRRMPDKRPA